MIVRSRTLRRGAALAAAATLLVAAPAAAHPFFRGGEAPVDSLATLTLAMAHGCGDEASGGGDPTTDVALEVPDWMRVVEVPAPDGWSVELEGADTGRVEVVTWTADGAVEPAPDFDLDVVVTGDVGDERYVRVFQACDDVEYRWVGTPGEPADDPAIRLVLVEADPDSPAPPEPDPGTDEGAEDGADEGADEGTDDGAGGTDDATEGTDDGAGADDGADPGDADVTDDEVDGAPLAADTDEAGLPWLWVVLAVVVVVGVLAGLLRARRRGPGPTEV